MDKKQFSKIWYFNFFFFFFKVTNIQKSNLSLFGKIFKNVLEVFYKDIAVLAGQEKCIFLIGRFWGPFATSPTRYGPKILPDRKILNGTFVR